MGEQLAVIGAGNLGLAVVRRLVEAGHHPLVHDADPRSLSRAEEAGARPADPDRIGAEAGTVWTLVPDARALADVLTDGFLRALGGRGLVLQSSTVAPTTARELAGRGERLGVAVVDAPVSGGADAARAGELLVLLGGAEDAVGRAEHVLAPVASTTVRTGAAGTASLVKLANQHALFAALAGLHEAVALATAGGVDEATVVTALGSGTVRSWLTGTWGFYDRLSRDYDDREVPTEHRPWVKDLAEVARVADDLGVELPSLAGTRAHLPGLLHQHARDAGQDPTRHDQDPTQEHGQQHAGPHPQTQQDREESR